METIETVPLAAYESQASRFSRIIKWLIMGWAISVVALGLVLVISLSYSEELVTETTEVSQEADNYGSNAFTYGDYYDGYANSQGNEIDQNDQEGASVANSD